jgi:hypothetical protein
MTLDEAKALLGQDVLLDGDQVVKLLKASDQMVYVLSYVTRGPVKVTLDRLSPLV